MSESNIARWLQRKSPELKYQQALNIVRKAQSIAVHLKRASPDRKYNEILREEAEKLCLTTQLQEVPP